MNEGPPSFPHSGTSQHWSRSPTSAFPDASSSAVGPVHRTSSSHPPSAVPFPSVQMAAPTSLTFPSTSFSSSSSASLSSSSSPIGYAGHHASMTIAGTSSSPLSVPSRSSSPSPRLPIARAHHPSPPATWSSSTSSSPPPMMPSTPSSPPCGAMASIVLLPPTVGTRDPATARGRGATKAKRGRKPKSTSSVASVPVMRHCCPAAAAAASPSSFSPALGSFTIETGAARASVSAAQRLAGDCSLVIGNGQQQLPDVRHGRRRRRIPRQSKQDETDSSSSENEEDTGVRLENKVKEEKGQESELERCMQLMALRACIHTHMKKEGWLCFLWFRGCIVHGHQWSNTHAAISQTIACRLAKRTTRSSLEVDVVAAACSRADSAGTQAGRPI